MKALAECLAVFGGVLLICACVVLYQFAPIIAVQTEGEDE